MEVNLNLYSVADVRELDRRAIEDHGIPAYELMCRAGAAALAAARWHWPDAARVCVVCGAGNNGGDGMVFARLARDAGLGVDVVCVGTPGDGGAAARARTDWLAAGGSCMDLDGALPPADLLVDALFGVGLSRPPAGTHAAAIAAMDAAGAPVLALDAPSGVDADTGAVPGRAVHAEITVTFIARKRGLYTGAALEYSGAVELAPLDVPNAVFDDTPPAAVLLPHDFVSARLPPRRRDTHKGAHGHVLVVGGAPGMGGAPLLAGEAALRCGVGMVTVALHPDTKHTGCAELMVHAIGDAAGLESLIARATVIALGPGLGRDDWAGALYAKALSAGLPLVVDADALHLLAASPAVHPDRVSTPHPGEAARLLGSDTATVQADRFSAADALAARYGGAVVLKGAGTLVAAVGQPVAVCDAGNPGMATAGTGDVLTGVIAALRAQGLDTIDAARGGAMLHARAGDIAAAAAGPRGMLASDLFAPLRELVNGRT